MGSKSEHVVVAFWLRGPLETMQFAGISRTRDTKREEFEWLLGALGDAKIPEIPDASDQLRKLDCKTITIANTPKATIKMAAEARALFFVLELSEFDIFQKFSRLERNVVSRTLAIDYCDITLSTNSYEW